MAADERPIELRFDGGTLDVRHADADELGLLSPELVPDLRTGGARAPARAYAGVVRALVRRKRAYTDHAKRYEELARGLLVHRAARPYQEEAVLCWERAHGRGVVVLPTGSGKSHVALMAIDRKRRSTLVVAPTLDLVRQWYDLLRTSFGVPIGVVGGGEHDVRALTVTTYDSAHLHMEHLGDRFGLLVFDECHHLPGVSYSLAADFALAPFRLGLTATPERSDGREVELERLIGPVVHRRDIVDLAGDYLADYEVQRIDVALTEDERVEYEMERANYVAFVRQQGIDLRKPDGWSQFVMRSARSVAGRAAMRAYRRQKELATAASAKLGVVEQLLHDHRRDRTLVFTSHNATAYTIARRYLLPVITHQTKVKERSEILDGLAEGRYSAVVTSRVLNEGVDVPSANVAIVVSGSGSVTEHVQRLGRILRKAEGKRALLYELVTSDTAEGYVSRRRREHSAYR